MGKFSKDQYIKLIRDCELKARYLYFDPIYQNFLESKPADEGEITMETRKASCVISVMIKLGQDKRCYEKKLIELMVTENSRYYSDALVKND